MYKHIVFLFLMLCCFDIYASNCLETIWGVNNTTEEEKKFDLENDLTQYGVSYSCYAVMSASQIEKFLRQLKEAIDSGNQIALSNMFKYPFYVYVNTQHASDGKVVNAIKIASPKQFKSRYETIITPMISRLIRCSSLKNMATTNDGEIYMGLGAVTFAGRYKNQRRKREIEPLITSINLKNTEAEIHNMDSISCL
ncbi:MAG: hypothetical protein ABUS47_16255 [Steroidobacter sp.]